MKRRRHGFEFVGFWKRVLAALIDGAIGFAFLPLTIWRMGWIMEHRSLWPEVLWIVVWTTVMLWIVVRFGGTPGKLIVGVRVVDRAGHFLSWGRAFRRVLVPHMAGAVIGLLQWHKVLGTFPDSTPHATFMEMGRLLNTYGQPYSLIGMCFGYFLYLDLGAILMNDDKRAIHDYIAGSYVVTKRSYEYLASEAEDSPPPLHAQTPPSLRRMLLGEAVDYFKKLKAANELPGLTAADRGTWKLGEHCLDEPVTFPATVIIHATSEDGTASHSFTFVKDYPIAPWRLLS